MCGSRRIRRVCETVTFRHANPVSIPDVCFDRCDNCGERFFDHEANEKIDAVIFGSRGRGAKRKSA